MKKMVFAFQVFGLIIMFPTYVVLEMNHGRGRWAENNSLPGIPGKIVKTGIGQSKNTEVQNRNAIFYITQKWLCLNAGF